VILLVGELQDSRNKERHNTGGCIRADWQLSVPAGTLADIMQIFVETHQELAAVHTELGEHILLAFVHAIVSPET